MRISTGFVNPLQITSTAQGISGKVTLPVNRSDSFYAQYKYVKGIPAVNSQKSVPLKRLEVLNSMINSLQHLREISSKAEKYISPEDINLTSDINQSIRVVGEQIHDKLIRQPPLFSNTLVSAASTGLAFNLSA
jgi:hypothetical protein